MRIYFRGNLYGCNQATAFVEDKGKIILSEVIRKH